MNPRLPAKLTAATTTLLVTTTLLLLDTAPAAAATGVPQPPDNLRVESLAPDEMTVAWDPVPGAAEYKVTVIPLEPFGGYRRIDADDPTVHLDRLTWDVPYRVTVLAFVPTAYPNWYTETTEIVATTPLPDGYFLPTPPTNLRIERDYKGNVTFLRWDAGTGFGTPLVYDLQLESPQQPELTGTFDRISGQSIDLRTTPLLGGWLRPGDTVSIWLTAVDKIRNRADSERVTLTCCPL
ncbi:MAG TPA: fibronectin type III domain-containing protein [Natronosporangium sp.]